MTRYVALLRGVNVGGNRKIAMADLRRLADDLDLEGARTLLNSGNLVFGVRQRSGAALEELLEREAATRLGLQTHFMVRSAGEWDGIISRNPFTQEARRDPGHVIVMCLKKAPPKGAVDALRAANHGPEVIHESGRELYIVFPRGMGTSKLVPQLTEARLGSAGTGRNWNTVLKLQAAARA